MRKIVSVVGARPNYVKLAAVWDAFKIFEHIVVDTGQHYDYEMNKVFFEQLLIPEPHYFLGIGSGSHGYQVGEAVKRIEEVLLREKPDLVVVYGDTNSALAGALASVKAGFRVAHVEAGLRIYDMTMQEEINRRVIDHVSSLLFAPTPSAVLNLMRENVVGKIFLTYDVHVDLLQKWRHVIEERVANVISRFGLSKDYIVLTLHRAENVDVRERLEFVAKTLKNLSKQTTVFFPVHPRTKKNLERFGISLDSENIIISQPLGYLDFLAVVLGAKAVLTDSGGVQREAYILGKRVGVLRERTEWVELVEHGCIELLGFNIEKIQRFINTIDATEQQCPEGLLGDGKAAQRIATLIASEIGS